jgi:nucleoid-associated protein
MTVKRLDLDHIRLAARINLSEWKNNPKSRQYISYLKGKQGRRLTEYFRDFIGAQEGVDGPSETRTLLKAFSDFVESEDLGEESAREKTHSLVSYSMAHAKLGESITLDELSEVLDDDQPTSFADFIRAKDYGLSDSIPPDKKTLNKFRRFTGRAEGLSISFEQHLLGSTVEFDAAGGTLTLRGLPTQLTEQLRRAAP